MYAMSKEEFINKYIQDLAYKRKRKEKMLYEYLYQREKEKPWGIYGVTK